MSEENVEIVRREYAAFATRDWEALAELCHPDLEYETYGPPGRLRGFREMTAYFDEWANVFGELRVEAEEIIDLGDQVVAVERQDARGLKGSEAEGTVGYTIACLISFKDGRISRVKEYATREEALEAAGLREYGRTSVPIGRVRSWHVAGESFPSGRSARDAAAQGSSASLNPAADPLLLVAVGEPVDGKTWQAVRHGLEPIGEPVPTRIAPIRLRPRFAGHR